MSPLELDIAVEAAGWHQAVPDAEARVRAAAAAALEAAAGAGAAGLDGSLEASVVLADDDAVRALNRDYRGRDAPTNVLSFPAGDPGAPGRPRHLGDVVAALGVLCREAAAQGIPVGDHLSHLVVHGMLHLVGYDHEGDAEAAEMETLEVAVLARLGVADPYLVQGDGCHDTQHRS